MVIDMLKNANLKSSLSQPVLDKGNEGGTPSLDWILASGSISTYPDSIYEKAISILREKPFSDSLLNDNLSPLRKGMSEIQDPLWRRICGSILSILGPTAFADLWKTKLIRISPEGKVAYLSCPNQEVAETIENYHFVVMGALKEFYPYLSSIETEIKEEEALS
jgi:hypothetical protein